MFLSHTASTQSDTASEFHDIFSGEGKLEQKLHREVDQSVQPVVTVLPVRKLPFVLRDPLKQELERLVKTDVPTNWISSMLVVIKKSNGKIRLCTDPKPLS